MTAPMPLNAEQEQAAKEWAADDRLWTTQETVEFNLRTFARLILKLAPAAHQETPEPPELDKAAATRLGIPNLWRLVARLAVRIGCETALNREADLAYKELLDLVGAPARAAEWQPISSAPTDGLIVLLAEFGRSGSRNYYVGHFASKTGGREHWLTIPGAWERNPTHWQPLLPPGALAGDSNSKR